MKRFGLAILSSVSLAAIMAAPAYAQTSQPLDANTDTSDLQTNSDKSVTNDEGQSVSTGDIVVTGSRIRRDNFATPQNVDIFTRDDEILAGSRSTTDVLQSGTVTSGTSQISGSFRDIQSLMRSSYISGVSSSVSRSVTTTASASSAGPRMTPRPS